MKHLLSCALALVLGAATYGAATLGSPEAEACGIRRAPAPVANVAGTYQSTYGTVVLEQRGRQITGRYDCCGGGVITGNMSDTMIRFQWKQPGASGSGTWKLAVDAATGKPSGKALELSGTWAYDGSTSSAGVWNLVQRPSALAVWRN